MKRFFVFGALCYTLKASAQQNALDVANRATRPANVPAWAKTKMTRGSKTWFFGATPIEDSHRNVFLHIYETNPKANAVFAASHTLALDIWQHASQRRHAPLQRINRVRFTSLQPNDISVRVLWLLPAKRRKPILQVSSYQYSNGEFARSTSDTLFVFDEGLQSRPESQLFGDESSITEATQTLYNTVDERGYLKVTREHIVATNANNPERTFLLWNGQHWMAPPAIAPTQS